ncbi:MAG: hypothetical protein KDK28_12270 [Maritimibacter sp.]|nr:hypothetical protein [Maritimibacter sp.]
MKTLLIAAAASVTSFFVAAPVVADVPTINVLVVQEDWDEDSLIRNNRIQTAVLNTLNQTLHAPAYQSVLQRYGISGMDVYDETFLTLNFYEQDRQRRRDEELISIAQTVNNPEMDVLVPYTIYARAVTDPYTQIVKLQMSLNYRAINIRDGRWMGGDNLDIDTAGVPFTGCATGINGTPADPHCVKEFVSQYGEQLARNAGNKLAIQLAGSLGRAYGSAPSEGAVTDPAAAGTNAAVSGETMAYQAVQGCGNIPTTFQVQWIGFEQRQINAIEEHMNFWKCALDTDVTDSDFSQVTFSYKTRADKARVIRNIRLMLELIGQVAEPRTEGSNTIVVEALGIREN